jgi:hypothetical protein
MTKFAMAFAQLVSAGSVDENDPEVRKVVYDELGLPVPEGGFEDAPPKPTLPPVIVHQAPPQLPPGDQAPPDDKAPIGDAKTFTEPVTDGLRERAAKVWRDSMPAELADLLDAEVA